MHWQSSLGSSHFQSTQMQVAKVESTMTTGHQKLPELVQNDSIALPVGISPFPGMETSTY